MSSSRPNDAEILLAQMIGAALGTLYRDADEKTCAVLEPNGWLAGYDKGRRTQAVIHLRNLLHYELTFDVRVRTWKRASL